MPAARRSDAFAEAAHRVSGTCWRIVEGQHHVATLALVDSLAEQQRLEQLIESTKPTLPEECRDLHYLLSTPFRYRPYPTGSRFRRAGMTPGIFYAAAVVEAAVAEAAFYRLLFFAESPGTPWPAGAAEHTAFSVRYGSGKAIDLTRPPLRGSAHAGCTPPTMRPARRWRTRRARPASTSSATPRCAIRSIGSNVALLTCRAFRAKATGRDPELAHPPWPKRRAGAARVPGDQPGVRPRCLRGRSADRGNRVGTLALFCHFPRNGSAASPLVTICTPRHSRMKAESRMSTSVPVSPRRRRMAGPKR